MKPLDLNLQDERVFKLLNKGAVGVVPTDTIYGLAGSALNINTVETIYLIRNRDSSKPLIILISSVDDLQKFNINLTKQQNTFLQNIWPNPVSVILSCPDDEFIYLHRGKKSLAFRVPDNKTLLGLLKITGPLVAPSANPEKQKPAENIMEAKKYFGNKVAFYVDAGDLQSKPSTVVHLYEDGKRIILREGIYKFKNDL